MEVSSGELNFPLVEAATALERPPQFVGLFLR